MPAKAKPIRAQSGDGTRYSVDARGGEAFQIGDNNYQVNYIYKEFDELTWSDGVAPPPLASVRGKVDSPYRGLSAFREGDAPFFFGRDKATTTLLAKMSNCLEGTGLLIVSGVSGAGKSSLLRAGVLARIKGAGLANAPEVRSWPRLVLTPTRAPMDGLAAGVAPIIRVDAASARRSLEADPAGFALTARQAALARSAGEDEDPAPRQGHQRRPSRHPRQPRLLLVVDQFEQLFTQCDDEEQRGAFITALHAAASVPHEPDQKPAALVVLSVRADFEAPCAEYPQLFDAVQDRYLVASMTERQLRLAITGPVKKVGSNVENDLTDELLREMHAGHAGISGAGVLPLLSHALDQAWRAKNGDALTLADYERTGGIEGAVADSAQSAYDRLNPAQQSAARQVFTRLTATSSDGKDTANRVTKFDLLVGKNAAESRDVDAVLEAFTAERLLTLAADSVQISHEVLLTAWPLLRDTWLAETHDDRMVRTRLHNTAAEWAHHSRDPSYLYSGNLLRTANETASRIRGDRARHPPLSRDERDFLQTSNRFRRRNTRRWLGAAAVVTALAVAAGTAVALARHYDSSAGEEHAIALSRQLAAASLNVDATDPVTARQLALAAWSVYPTSQAISEVSDDLTEQVTNGYLPADAAGSGIPGSLGNPGGVNAVAFSPDGKLLATGGANVRLWNPVTGQPVGVPLGTPGTEAAGLAFSPDGRLLAAADTSGDVQLWHVATRQPAGALLTASPVPGAAQAPTDLFSGTSGQQVAFSTDGTLVASGGSDGYARVWNVATGRLAGRPIAVDPYTAATRRTLHYGVNAVAFSQTGRLLATAAANGYVRLWDPATGTAVGGPILTAAGPGFGGPDAHALAFSPDGKTLATAGTAMGVQLWNTASHVQVGKPLGVPHRARTGAPPAIAASCSALTFSPDGKRLACAGPGTGPELIDIASGQVTGLYPPAVQQGVTDQNVSAVAFSPAVGGAGLLASGNSDGTATLWDIAAHSVVGAPLSTYPAHAAPVRGIGLASSGQRLYGPYSNGYAHLITSSGPSGAGRNVLGLDGMAFSPDGLLAAASTGHYLQLLDARTGQTRLRLLAAAGQKNTVTSALFSPDGGIVASVDQHGIVRLWGTATGTAIGAPLAVGGGDLGVPGGQPAMGFSPDSRLLALASIDGNVSLISTATGQPDGAPLPVNPVPRPTPASTGNGPPAPPAPPPPPSEGGRINTVAFSPDGKLLAAAGADGYIRVWGVTTRRPTGDPIPAAVGAGVRSVAFSPAGTVLASVAGDGSARLWNPTSGTPLGLPLSTGTSTQVTDPVLASFSPDGGLIALMTSVGDMVAWPEWLVADPHQALCEQVGPPPSYVWSKYAHGEREPDMCH